MKADFRSLPSVDQVVSHWRLRVLQGQFPRALVVDLTRRELEIARTAIADGHASPSLDEVAKAVADRLDALAGASLRPLINASGVLLHTNLGRAPLSEEAAQAMASVATRYSNLEFDLDRGRRSSRNVHVEAVLCQLTGAEAALVVNNNASGVLLALTALARRKEVVVSRGQAVEIGGSFRIPDVMRQSGARLVEVGTTNCTYALDYEQAVTERTAALMRVHSSNFRVVGFVNEVTLQDVVDVGRRHGIPVLDDLGSGCFLDTRAYGLAPEPMVQESVAAGAALTLFSGDKLVGGPQAGIIVGRKELIDKLKRHPLARAVRTDKIRLAGLVATLLHYLKNEATEKIPVWRMVAMPLEEIGQRARRWAEVLGPDAELVDGESMVGGGSLPGATLPTRLVAVRRARSVGGPQALGRALRSGEPSVVGRISEDMLLLDPRSVLPEEDEAVLAALRALVETAGPESARGA